MNPRRCISLLVAGLAPLAGCEALVGIHDKTLGPDPAVSCAQQPPGFVFCDDFDNETSFLDVWLWDTPEAGATIDYDTTDFRSAPKSAKIFAPPSSPQAQLGKTVGTFSQGFRLAFDLRVDVDDMKGLPQVSVAQALAAGNNLSVNYLLGPDDKCQLYAYDTSGGWSVTQDLPLPTLRQWTRVVMAYDATAGLSVLVDGSNVYTDTTATRGAPGETDVIVGSVYLNPGGSTNLQVELDDVVMRGQ